MSYSSYYKFGRPYSSYRNRYTPHPSGRRRSTLPQRIALFSQLARSLVNVAAGIPAEELTLRDRRKLLAATLYLRRELRWKLLESGMEPGQANGVVPNGILKP